jgi:hypothetical protein
MIDKASEVDAVASVDKPYENVIECSGVGNAHAIFTTNDSSATVFEPRETSSLFVPPSTT